ncbi:uncharacterized protein BCR38DRAFT_459648 [Pseudomassariella vexata]|uniref:Zinc finger PHD-type domain-containing protein n=1 Tax=Pseudomassariella vexata TaxID=1141098 RepID=A0A1Y2DN85_9PEZI|nr:uncharacterized protein BCR38DRAFT_459648 [Pseudomassariella vexata]ORY60606.1 hypothetical protein BCR38DRAFT_459648 [Pseudomassariella vexata]
MAGTSPTRRSSRARTTQSQSHHSSANSSSSGRAERTTRGFVKTGSPHKSSGTGSLSSEPPEDSTPTTASTDDTALLRRRSTRGKDEDRDKQPKMEQLDIAITSDDNEIQEEDEAVRCVCGFDDWPGPPQFDDELKDFALKDAIDLEPIYSVVEITSDNDMAGFFVQCDICKVWEHGLCVGIVTEESSPDEYYCELCRKDLHKVFTASNGQKYSVYLPIHRPSRSTSRATSTAKDGTRSPKSTDRKSSRASAAAQSSSAKRRSTMNSRDAAYDEEEQLRRAIEASKEDTIVEEPELLTRRAKRIRDEDEECVFHDSCNRARIPSTTADYRPCRQLVNIKRQRTNSKSPSPLGAQALLASREDSDEEDGVRNGALKKATRNVARTHRERTERDERREEQERKRAEAASKRKGRAERRRADGITATTTIVVKVSEADMDVDIDSDPSEEIPLAARVAANRTTESVQPPDPPASSQPVPDTPPAEKVPTSSHKRKAASQHKKGKGRNQYTKDRDMQENEDTPARSMSREIARNADENVATHTKSSLHEGPGKHSSRAKGGMNSKITMSDLKRRANNILEFITRTQVELANEPLSEKNSPRHGNTDDGSTGKVRAMQPNGGDASKENTPVESGTANLASTTPAVPMKDFKELDCVEMMDALTRDLVKWQQEFVS